MIPTTLSSLGARLSAKPHAEGELDAIIDGIPTEVRFVLRTQGSSSSKWTEIRVRSEHLKGFAFTLDLDVRPAHGFEGADVRAGRLRDVVVGDAAFDDAFIVEAAPEEVVRLMFDATTRAELLALRPLRVLSTKAHAIVIERLDWVADVDLLERLTRLTVRIAAAITPAAREAAAARRRQAQERGYRERAPTDEEIRAHWDVDVARLASQAKERAAHERRVVLAFAFVVVVVLVIGVYLAVR
ncbi:MAG TPA: hypothetical protein VH054_14205 [Polyangiaceae bacterium]|jgi:hypothetical protein|nr:hypothetical protein [Polyangiaceae bacterium]